MNSREKNKTIVNRFFDDIWNGRRLDLFGEVFKFPYTITNLLTPDVPPKEFNRQELENHIQKWLFGFPDFYLNVQEMLVDKNRVMVRWISEGTHMQLFEGVQPTTKLIKFSTIGIFIVNNDKISSHSALVDVYTLYYKLGLIN